MKKIIVCLLSLLLLGCSHQDSMIEIEKGIYVEQEFKDSWLELNKYGDSYIDEELQGGYGYHYNRKYLNIFLKNNGRIELYNYSIKKENMIISGEMIPPSTIRLVHPNLDQVTSEGVIIHELGHYFDEVYHFSSSKEFNKLYKANIDIFNIKNRKEFFAECFKEYVGGHQEKVKPLNDYMERVAYKILHHQ